MRPGNYGSIAIRGYTDGGKLNPWKVFDVTIKFFTSVIEVPRGRPFGVGAGHHGNGVGTSRNYWNCSIFMGNPQNISLNVLWGYGIKCLRPRRCGIPQER